MIISFHSDIQHRIDDLLRPACLIQSVNAETEEESDQDLPPSQNSDAFDVISTHLSTDDLTAWRLFELAWWATKLVCSIKSFVILFYSLSISFRSLRVFLHPISSSIHSIHLHRSPPTFHSHAFLNNNILYRILYSVPQSMNSSQPPPQLPQTSHAGVSPALRHHHHHHHFNLLQT